MNRFQSDAPAEIDFVLSSVERGGAKAVFTDVFLKGGEGGKELAAAVAEACEIPSKLHFAYELSDSVEKEDFRRRPRKFTARTGRIFRRKRGRRLRK